MKLPIQQALEKMPKNRDMALDVARSWSLIIVVFGHFLMLIVYWNQDGTPYTSNILSSGNPWPYLTWIFQVMPLFFIAGGAVNYIGWQNTNLPWNQWTYKRFQRLMRPTLIFLLALAVIFTIISLTIPTQYVTPIVGGVTGPLWFLSVYIPVIALTPLTTKLHKKHKHTTISLMAAGIIAVDLLRFYVSGWLGIINLLLAWVLVHQMGYFYKDGISKKASWTLLASGLLLNIVFTTILDYYPKSLVGIPTESFSNTAPPTMILMFHAMFLLGAFNLLAPKIRETFKKPKALKATIGAGILAMSIYLWHMLILVAVLVGLHLIGLDLPTVTLEVHKYGNNVLLVIPQNINYWMGLLPVAILYGICVWGAAKLLWPTEFIKLPILDKPLKTKLPKALSAVAITLTAVGLLTVSGIGYAGFPLQTHDVYGITLPGYAGLLAILLGTLMFSLSSNPKPDTTTDKTKSDDVHSSKIKIWKKQALEKWKKIPAPIRKTTVAVTGSILILIGVVLVVLPGPFTLPFILAGFAILATEFAWAYSALEAGKHHSSKALTWIKTKIKPIHVGVALTVLTCILTIVYLYLKLKNP